ncbi:MAG: hypothetical protein QXG65_04190 [Thermoplasmata archaeon]
MQVAATRIQRNVKALRPAMVVPKVTGQMATMASAITMAPIRARAARAESEAPSARVAPDTMSTMPRITIEAIPIHGRKPFPNEPVPPSAPSRIPATSRSSPSPRMMAPRRANPALGPLPSS